MIHTATTTNALPGNKVGLSFNKPQMTHMLIRLSLTEEHQIAQQEEQIVGFLFFSAMLNLTNTDAYCFVKN